MKRAVKEVFDWDTYLVETLNCHVLLDVKSWLKSLRLHKYADIFTTMTYDEMMNMNADDLDEKVSR